MLIVKSFMLLTRRKGVRVVEGVDLERLCSNKLPRVRIPLFPNDKAKNTIIKNMFAAMVKLVDTQA
jgi:hypothetical protein